MNDKNCNYTNNYLVQITNLKLHTVICYHNMKIFTIWYIPPDQAPQTSPLVIKAVGPRGIDRQRRFGVWAVLSTQVPTVCQRSNDGKWACYNSRFKRELYGKEAASFALKVRMLKVEVIETLLYGCVT